MNPMEMENEFSHKLVELIDEQRERGYMSYAQIIGVLEMESHMLKEELKEASKEVLYAHTDA